MDTGLPEDPPPPKDAPPPQAMKKVTRKRQAIVQARWRVTAEDSAKSFSIILTHDACPALISVTGAAASYLIF
jgi:hypothetical protein